MSKRKTPIALLRIAGIAIVLFSLLGFAIALGPSRAARIAGAAAANVLIDGLRSARSIIASLCSNCVLPRRTSTACKRICHGAGVRR